jgi:SAM-dependent methyltransferase
MNDYVSRLPGHACKRSIGFTATHSTSCEESGRQAMPEVTYDAQTVMSANPLARYAHRKRMAVALRLIDELCPPSGTVVDFGSGPGLLLHELGELRHDVSLVGYDPYMSPAHPEVRYADSMEMIEADSVCVLTAFEVCEHLYETEIEQLLVDAARILKPGALLIISVPIMYGFAVIPKVLNWMILRHNVHTDYRVREILMSSVGVRVARPANPRPTHKGFDFRELRETIVRRFDVERVLLSPIAWMPWWLSSQYFMVCRQTA